LMLTDKSVLSVHECGPLRIRANLIFLAGKYLSTRYNRNESQSKTHRSTRRELQRPNEV